MEVIEQEDSKRKSLSETGKKTKSILSVNSGRKSQRKRISWGNLQYRSFSKNDTLLNTSQDKHSLQGDSSLYLGTYLTLFIRNTACY